MGMRNQPRPANVFGIDIGKNIFHVSGSTQPASRFKRRPSDAKRSCSSSHGLSQPWLEWKPALAHNDWLARSPQWGTRSGSCRPSS